MKKIKLIIKGIILYTTLFQIGILVCADNITLQQLAVMLPITISGVIIIKHFISEKDASILLGWELMQKYC